MVRDRERRIFTDPDKVHQIGHKGRYFKVPGVQLTRAFAATHAGALSGRRVGPRARISPREHAECVFVAAPSKAGAEEAVAAIRASVARRRPRPAQRADLKLLTVIVDETDAKAQAKFEDYQAVFILDGALALDVRLDRHRLRRL